MLFLPFGEGWSGCQGKITGEAKRQKVFKLDHLNPFGVILIHLSSHADLMRRVGVMSEKCRALLPSSSSLSITLSPCTPINCPAFSCLSERNSNFPSKMWIVVSLYNQYHLSWSVLVSRALHCHCLQVNDSGNPQLKRFLKITFIKSRKQFQKKSQSKKRKKKVVLCVHAWLPGENHPLHRQPEYNSARSPHTVKVTWWWGYATNLLVGVRKSVKSYWSNLRKPAGHRLWERWAHQGDQNLLPSNTAEDVQECDVALVAADMKEWIPQRVRKVSSRIRILHLRRADLDLLWKQGGFPRKTALKGREAQESWQGFKDSLLQAQEHSVADVSGDQLG